MLKLNVLCRLQLYPQIWVNLLWRRSLSMNKLSQVAMKPRLYHFGIAYLHQCFGVYPESLALKQYLEGSCWLRFIILLKSDCSVPFRITKWSYLFRTDITCHMKSWNMIKLFFKISTQSGLHFIFGNKLGDNVKWSRTHRKHRKRARFASWESLENESGQLLVKQFQTRFCTLHTSKWVCKTDIKMALVQYCG